MHKTPLNKKNLSVCFFITFLTTMICSINAEILITANNPHINYYGRFDFATSGVAKFNWSGSTIEASFEANQLESN